MPPKVTLVWVPGSWHTPEYYDTTIAALGDEYEHVKSPNASVGAEPPLMSRQPDVDGHMATTRAVLEAGRDVVLVCHSYGSVPAAHVAEAYSHKALGEGKSYVRGMVLVSAYTPPLGPLNFAPPSSPNAPPAAPSWVQIVGNGLECIPDPEQAREVFYADVDKAVTDKLVVELKPSSLYAVGAPVASTGYLDVPTAYLLCTEDKAVPIEYQSSMVEWLAKEGNLVMQAEMPASHFPFLSQPEATATFISKAIEAFLALMGCR